MSEAEWELSIIHTPESSLLAGTVWASLVPSRIVSSRLVCLLETFFRDSFRFVLGTRRAQRAECNKTRGEGAGTCSWHSGNLVFHEPEIECRFVLSARPSTRVPGHSFCVINRSLAAGRYALYSAYCSAFRSNCLSFCVLCVIYLCILQKVESCVSALLIQALILLFPKCLEL